MTDAQSNDSNAEYQNLWPVPILIKHMVNPASLNQSLIDLFYQHKEKHETNAQASSYASSDDLLNVYKDHNELQQLTKFIMDGVFDVAAKVNGKYWQRSKVQNLKVNVSGLWFQITNNYTFHELHVHGNCSWSGVYYVQAGEVGDKSKDKTLGFPNGVTRFYGPYMEYQGNAHIDLGNVYLMDTRYDSLPEDGKLVIFPSYLKHMPFPYVGDKDRIIVSFHASISGDKPIKMNYSFT